MDLQSRFSPKNVRQRADTTKTVDLERSHRDLVVQRRCTHYFVAMFIFTYPRNRVFAIYQLCWVEKHINTIVKPTNSPTTQGQPNPGKKNG